MCAKKSGLDSFVDAIKESFAKPVEELMEAAGFSEQGNGLLVPKTTAEMYPSDSFSTEADGELVENMAAYYSRATVDGMVALKTLIDSDGNLLCAVVSKGIGGTSYYYEKDEKGKPQPICSPMTAIDLAMSLVSLQRNNTLLSWGALTADFRLLYEKGLAQDEWALLAANHVDMLYQLRVEAGSKINMQLACLSMGITAVEQDARSFKVEEAIKTWKTGDTKDRNMILDSLRAYCKLMLALYGSIAENKEFKYKPKDSRLIENAPVSFPIEWGRVWEVHKEKWEGGNLSSQSTNSDAYVSVNVMHNWLEAHAQRSKKTLQQLTSSNNSLTDLISRT